MEGGQKRGHAGGQSAQFRDTYRYHTNFTLQAPRPGLTGGSALTSQVRPFKCFQVFLL